MNLVSYRWSFLTELFLQCFHDPLGDAAMESITQTCIDILEERFWRSFGGDPMRIAVCHFIQDLSS